MFLLNVFLPTSVKSGELQEKKKNQEFASLSCIQEISDLGAILTPSVSTVNSPKYTAISVFILLNMKGNCKGYIVQANTTSSHYQIHLSKKRIKTGTNYLTFHVFNLPLIATTGIFTHLCNLLIIRLLYNYTQFCSTASSSTAFPMTEPLKKWQDETKQN